MDPDDFAAGLGNTTLLVNSDATGIDPTGDDPLGGDMPPVNPPDAVDPNDPLGGGMPPVNPPDAVDPNDPLGGGTPPRGSTPVTPAPTIPAELKNLLRGLIVGDDGKPNPMGLFGIMSLLSMMRGSNAPAQVGYQGKVPKFAAVRERVPITEDPNRRPGAGGRRYFSDTTYVPQDRAATAADANAAAKAAAVTAAKTQAAGLKQAPYTAPVTAKPGEKTGGIESLIKETKSIGGGSKVADLIKVPEYNTKGEVVQTMDPSVPVNKEPLGNDLMDRVKAANPQLDWSKYNPNKMTMDYDDFDQAIGTFLRNMSGARGRASDQGKSIGATGGLSSVLGMLGGRSNVGPVKPSTSYGDTPEDFGYTDEQFADMLLRQSTLPPPPRPVEPGVRMAARGGLMNLAKGRYLNGATDGMADKIPANIEGTQPAALSHGEFVIPADVVSHLGNGNSESGAQRLYDMMDRIRKARTGSPKQGKQINPDKFLPR